MSKKIELEEETPLTSYSYHEAIHTAYVLMDTWDSHVSQSRAVMAHPELVEKAQKAIDAMYDVYNALGDKEEWCKAGADRLLNDIFKK